jgi:proteasome lid subunit RPN8/RPN11
MIFIFPYNERQRLHRRAYRAQQKDQSEVCGVVVASPDCRLRLQFLPNHSARSWSFEISDSDFKEARKKANENGERFIGLFHSHIASEAVLGPRDLENARLTHLQLVYDICGREVRLWKVKKVDGQKVPVEVPLVSEPRSKQPTRSLDTDLKGGSPAGPVG